MVLPGQPPHGPSGRGPFGEKAFRAALAGCAVLVAGGLPAALLGSGAVASVGTSLLVLGLLGLVTGGGGLLAERQVRRRRRPPTGHYRHNGQGPGLDPALLRKTLRRRR